jgi:alpha-L-fucosidase
VAETGHRAARDVVGELAAACRAEGVVFCAYHSICDWRHPDYPLGSPGGRTRKPAPDMDRYVAYLKGQVAELLRSYGPLGVLWFDGEWEDPWTEERGVDLYRHCRALQPSLIGNTRVAKGRRGMEGGTAAGAFAGDYDTPEQRVGRFQPDRPWESCITLGRQWSWKPDDELKPLDECVRTLVACAGGDGNLLLNLGPMPTGEIEPRQAARLARSAAGGSWRPPCWAAARRRPGRRRPAPRSTSIRLAGVPWTPSSASSSTTRPGRSRLAEGSAPIPSRNG